MRPNLHKIYYFLISIIQGNLEKIILIYICVIFLVCVNKTESIQQKYTDIDHTILTEIRNENIPGAVVLISKDNNIVYHQAYGFAQKYAYDKNPLTNPIPMQKTTLFDAASLTKVFAILSISSLPVPAPCNR